MTMIEALASTRVTIAAGRERSRARSRSRSRRMWDPHRRPPRARKPEQAGHFGLRVKIAGDPDDATYLLRKSAFDVACWDSMIPTPRCVNLWSKTAKRKARRKREEQRASARGRAASWNPTADSARSQSDTRTSKPKLVLSFGFRTLPFARSFNVVHGFNAVSAIHL